VTFVEAEGGSRVSPESMPAATTASELLGMRIDELCAALTSKKIYVQNVAMTTKFDPSKVSCRGASHPSPHSGEGSRCHCRCRCGCGGETRVCGVECVAGVGRASLSACRGDADDGMTCCSLAS
jgi:hypothetical protein